MSKKNNPNARGQHDRKKSRQDTVWALLMNFGVPPSYRPPRDRKDREAYEAGWQNAKNRK